MADNPPPNHAQAIEGVLGTFESELRRLSDRATEIQAHTVKNFGMVHSTFDHAEYINDVVEKANFRLSRFLGPPPNTIAIPKAERDQVEIAQVIEG